MRKPEFVYVSYFEATPEKLREALTNSEFIPLDALFIAGLEEVYHR